MSLTPHAQELAAIEAHVTKATVTLVTKLSLSQVAAQLGIVAHPLVGQKYPGVDPQPPTWPANKATAALGEHWELRIPVHHSPWGPPAPIVVVVNSTGVPITGAAEGTLLDDEALARGWFYLSVKCLTNLTFPGTLASLSIDAALRSVIAKHNVDRRRIYLIGSSRGAGILMSWAASRQAGIALMPAAVVAVSPLLEVREWWSKLPPESGTGQPEGANDNVLTTRAHSERPDNLAGVWDDSREVNHRYRTHGPLHFDVGSYAEHPDAGPSPLATVDVTRSIGVSLRQVPTWVIHDTEDPVVVIPTGCDKFHEMMTGLAGGGTERTVTTGVGSLHGFGLLDVPGGVTAAAVMDFFASKTCNPCPPSMEVVAADDIPFGITRPLRADVDDTCRYTFAQSLTPAGKGYVLGNVVRLARIEFDVSRDAALASFDFSAGCPFTLDSSAGTVLRLKHLHHAPTSVSGTGILPGGEGVGYLLGVDGPGSVEILPAGAGPMSVAIT
jgi:acetyl esterase/lipase